MHKLKLFLRTGSRSPASDASASISEEKGDSNKPEDLKIKTPVINPGLKELTSYLYSYLGHLTVELALTDPTLDIHKIRSYKLELVCDAIIKLRNSPSSYRTIVEKMISDYEKQMSTWKVEIPDSDGMLTIQPMLDKCLPKKEAPTPTPPSLTTTPRP